MAAGAGTGAQRGGAIDSALELAGDRVSCKTEHQKSKELHRADEELAPSSPIHLAQAEDARTELAAAAERSFAQRDLKPIKTRC